jgi:hypothetical protein
LHWHRDELEVRCRKQSQHREDHRDLGEADTDDPLDELSPQLRQIRLGGGSQLVELCSQLRQIRLGGQIGQIDILSLFDGARNRFGLLVGESGRFQVLYDLMRVEAADRPCLFYIPARLASNWISHCRLAGAAG